MLFRSVSATACIACSHVLTLLVGAPLSPHEAPQLGKSGKGLLFSRDAPPPQCVSDVVSSFSSHLPSLMMLHVPKILIDPLLGARPIDPLLGARP